MTAAIVHAFFTCSIATTFITTDPYSLGIGNARTVAALSNSAGWNPATLGVKFEPWGGEGKIPAGNSVSVGYWSDKLALVPYREFFFIEKEWPRITAQVINESFRVAGKTPSEVSREVSRRLKDGVSIFGGSSVVPAGLTIGKIAADVRTSVDFQVDLPGAPFLVIFSDEEWFRNGVDLPISHLGAAARVYTDITVSYGLPIDLSHIAQGIDEFTRGVFDLKHASCGAGLTFTVGNCYVDLETQEGAVRWNEEQTKISLDAAMKFKASGLGLKRNWKFGSRYQESFLPAGAGAGINAGVFMHGDHASAGIVLSRFGPMVWRGIREADIKVHTRNFTVADLFEKDFDAFDPDSGGVYPDFEKNPPLRNAPKQFEWQPTRLNIGLGYRFYCGNSDRKSFHAVSEYVNTMLEYEQSLAPWPGRSFIPRIAIGAENGFLWGVLPVRVGFVFGGAEKIASCAGFGLGYRFLFLQAGYEAVGTPYWFPRRGVAFSIGLTASLQRHIAR